MEFNEQQWTSIKTYEKQWKSLKKKHRKSILIFKFMKKTWLRPFGSEPIRRKLSPFSGNWVYSAETELIRRELSPFGRRMVSLPLFWFRRMVSETIAENWVHLAENVAMSTQGEQKCMSPFGGKLSPDESVSSEPAEWPQFGSARLRGAPDPTASRRT